MNKIGLQLLVIFLGMNTWLLSQCCPYITSVEVLPQNPNESDAIRVATYISTPGNGAFINHQFHWENDTLVVEACYYSGALAVITDIYDTVDIGQVPAGDYVLHFLASTSIYEDSCVIGESQSYTTTFSVSDIVGLTPNESESPILYPNPAKEWVMLRAVPEKSVVQVFALTGEKLEVPMYSSDGALMLDVRLLAAGFYEVIEYSEGKVPSRLRFVKE
ncbi:MAG: hypothetical protein A3D31_10460 [Candidatus Fluviicola riflensis]|nr:MAG: hypothetical protein CHH17_14880 [Candidatus Fluviicola riflensis]OGS77422.1 MAG: hypothetical protein A3D31_10460 [Candidatus Fluviicola riflensis]OGS84002.1 MAG: hypothetical protein A3E30_11860 [Fluviicola sp. RIFCSPHIGHO2_12_FULL_43_24]OGS84489.1 MAG: hypothetical protein A2724_07400 [Fluviicola sp. RIFCSPHIGHO2_01_FULL_43_53]